MYSIGPSASIVSLRGFEVALQVGVAALAQLQNIVDKNYLALHKAFGEKLLHFKLRLICKLLAEQFVGGLEEAHISLGKEIVALGYQRVVHSFRVA